jgi:hypothetical protein
MERVWQFIKQQFKREVFLTLMELRERLAAGSTTNHA